MTTADTIVALSSGAVPAGVAVIRLSGPAAGATVTALVGRLPEPRKLTLATIRLGGEMLDRGLVAWMPGPHSFTGEDCAELQLHGSPAVVRTTLRGLTARHGLRLAEAGEFTRRAFENGKLDLTEVEGLGDLIAAETENQRRLAFARLDGGLTRQVEAWRERLLDLRAEIEAQLDFSDEGDVGALPASFQSELNELQESFARALQSLTQGRIMRDGFRVVLAGPPNVGKSSLLNALSQSEAAIVSDEAGTTRDLKEVPLDIAGQLVILVDSAGLRATSSQAEAMGIDRARAAMRSADMVLWLNSPDQAAEPPPIGGGDKDGAASPRMIRVGTKHDLGAVPGVDHMVSTLHDTGITELLAMLRHASGAQAVSANDMLLSRERDRESLFAAQLALTDAASHIDRPELAAEDLRRASMALERLLGRMDVESVLDRLFSTFCIGK